MKKEWLEFNIIFPECQFLRLFRLTIGVLFWEAHWGIVKEKTWIVNEISQIQLNGKFLFFPSYFSFCWKLKNLIIVVKSKIDSLNGCCCVSSWENKFLLQLSLSFFVYLLHLYLYNRFMLGLVSMLQNWAFIFGFISYLSHLVLVDFWKYPT